jgi:beta-N-acetylhexosaminidase
MFKFIGLFFFCLSLSVGVLVIPNFSLASELEINRSIERRIASMSLVEKVGQLFMVGFPQAEITPELRKFIFSYKPGSYILFKRNVLSINQIRSLNVSLYKVSYRATSLPPLIAIDQEGGAVSRLPIFPTPPSALSLGETKSPNLSEDLGFEMGRFLREVGFNMNLAPVLDVSDPYSPSFIGARSFGADPSSVATMGAFYSKGLLRARVIPTAKHFPGAGSLTSDPHYSVVINNESSDSLWKKDLLAYQEYFKLGQNIAVMLSHLVYPSLDPGGEPASFSKAISTNLLREKLEYQGLVITDDLQMQGSRKVLRPEAAALRALQAGSDIVMLTWSSEDQVRAFEYVKAAVEKGQLSTETLNVKLRRILRAKSFANQYRRSLDHEALVRGTFLSSDRYLSLEREILDLNFKKNVSSTADNQSSSLRSPASLERLCLITPSKPFASSFNGLSSKANKTLLLTGVMSQGTLKRWVSNKDCSLIVSAITGKKTLALLRALPTEKKKITLIVNLSTPSLIPTNEEFLKTLQLYFNHHDAGKKIAQNLQQILRELNFKTAFNE